MLQLLEKHYHSPVDTEFTVQVVDPAALRPEIRISLLQCRPQSHLKESEARLPKNLREKDIIFSTKRMAPQGRVSDIRYVVFVSPEDYYALPTQAARAELGRSVGRLNAALAERDIHLYRAWAVGHLQPGPGRPDWLRRYLQHARPGRADR